MPKLARSRLNIASRIEGETKIMMDARVTRIFCQLTLVKLNSTIQFLESILLGR